MNSVVILADRERTLTRRGAAVRRRLLELTTLILSRDGYSATTLQKLGDDAGLGRGSVLHQFPTRHDLMAAVTRFIADEITDLSRQQLARIADPWERLGAYPDIIWNSANTVSGIALAEIAFAARWEAGLYDRIHPEIERMNKSFLVDLFQTGREARIDDLGVLKTRTQLLTAAAHGLVLDRNLHHHYAAVDAAVDAMKNDYQRFVMELRGASAGDDGPNDAPPARKKRTRRA